jgi:hypothetical protein
VCPAGSGGLEDEIALLEGDGIIQVNREIRLPVAVHIAVDISVGDIADVA